MGVFLCIALDFILLGDVMVGQRYKDYKDSILKRKDFPFDLIVVNNIEHAVIALRYWARKDKLPYTIKRKFGKVIVNKKADA